MICGRVGPAWTHGEIEKPAGTRNMGTWTAAIYTQEQQLRLGVDELGKKRVAPISVVNSVASAGYGVSSTAPVSYASPAPITYISPTRSVGSNYSNPIPARVISSSVISPVGSVGSMNPTSSFSGAATLVTSPAPVIRKQGAATTPISAPSASLQQGTQLGSAAFEGGYSVTLVSKGMRTLQVTMHALTTEGCIEKPAGTKTEHVISICGSSSGRKAAAEKSLPQDLMYMKETVSLRDKSSGNFVGSVPIGNSADGTCDVWDGEEITIGLAETTALEPNAWKIVIERQTKLFGDPAIDDAVIKGLPGCFEAAEAEGKRCTKIETWEAAVRT